jgi:hypothetical protein
LKTDKNGLHTFLSCHPIVQKSGIEKPWGGGERRPDLKTISQQLMPPECAHNIWFLKTKKFTYSNHVSIQMTHSYLIFTVQ